MIETTFNALKALYQSTNGDNWIRRNNWDFSKIPDSMDEFNDWNGLIVNDGKLTTINLTHNRLTGSIPREIGDLTDLTTLILSSNELTGSIPREIGNLTNLKWLHLRRNRLTGSVPKEWNISI